VREIVIDTEMAGRDPTEGRRVVEIGAVELVNRSLTGQTFHCYLCPERSRRQKFAPRAWATPVAAKASIRATVAILRLRGVLCDEYAARRTRRIVVGLARDLANVLFLFGICDELYLGISDLTRRAQHRMRPVQLCDWRTAAALKTVLPTRIRAGALS
jgi:hypothetical protein